MIGEQEAQLRKSALVMVAERYSIESFQYPIAFRLFLCRNGHPVEIQDELPGQQLDRNAPKGNH